MSHQPSVCRFVTLSSKYSQFLIKNVLATGKWQLCFALYSATKPCKGSECLLSAYYRSCVHTHTQFFHEQRTFDKMKMLLWISIFALYSLSLLTLILILSLLSHLVMVMVVLLFHVVVVHLPFAICYFPHSFHNFHNFHLKPQNS